MSASDINFKEPHYACQTKIQTDIKFKIPAEVRQKDNKLKIHKTL